MNIDMFKCDLRPDYFQGVFIFLKIKYVKIINLGQIYFGGVFYA